MYEAVIKVNRTDTPAVRARDISEGIGYACALLHDEYEWSAGQIVDLLERTTDNVQDDYADEA